MAIDRFPIDFEYQGIAYHGIVQSLPERGYIVKGIPRWFHVSLNNYFYTYLSFNGRELETVSKKEPAGMIDAIIEFILAFYG
jgi:hypothetical protein